MINRDDEFDTRMKAIIRKYLKKEEELRNRLIEEGKYTPHGLDGDNIFYKEIREEYKKEMMALKEEYLQGE